MVEQHLPGKPHNHGRSLLHGGDDVRVCSERRSTAAAGRLSDRLSSADTGPSS